MRSSSWRPTARRTALKMRTWLPQRHTRVSNAFRISASLGFGILLQQRFRRQDPAVQAIAALENLLVDERCCTGWGVSRCPDLRA